ncbi:hypothetical protein LTR94_024383 [Friedmanniomyces endolithicus]|nr:hypothetical protein LTR94_024383 [Friedmanniomyces endolithicus]
MQGGRQPGPDHPITVEPASKRVRIHLGDTVLADSTNALILREANLPAVIYIPRSEVAMRRLTPSATSTHCPYKGDASYFSVAPDGPKDVAWSYETPFDHMAIIKDHIAFYPERVDAIEASPLPE